MRIFECGQRVKVNSLLGIVITETSNGLLIQFDDPDIGLKYYAPMWVSHHNKPDQPLAVPTISPRKKHRAISHRINSNSTN